MLLLATLSPVGPKDKLKLNSPLYVLTPETPLEELLVWEAETECEELAVSVVRMVETVD